MIITRNYLTSWPHDDQEWFVDIRCKSILQTNEHNPYVKIFPRNTALMFKCWATNVRSREFVLAVCWFLLCTGLCAPVWRNSTYNCLLLLSLLLLYDTGLYKISSKIKYHSMLRCIIYKQSHVFIHSQHVTRRIKTDGCEACQNIPFGICNQVQKQSCQKLETVPERIQKNTEKKKEKLKIKSSSD